MNQTHADSLQPGYLFAERYRVIRRIKAGAMGAVYEVKDETIDTLRALKIMLPGPFDDPDLRNRFLREAKVTARVRSDHIVENTHAGVDEATGHLFLVMELLEGEELGRLIRQRKKGLPPSEALVSLRQLAFALDKTHAAGIVHRDLKPDNLFITARDDGSPCLKILDFGIAKVVAESQEVNATRPLGTPLYMAPEQVRGKGVGPATDLYAFGQIAYTMFVGESYWGADAAAGGGAESILRLVTLVGATEPASERAKRRKTMILPKAFDEWFFRATALKPEDRFESGRTAIEALAIALNLPARDAMPSVIDMGEAFVPASLPSPGMVYRTAAIPITNAVQPDRALGDTNRPTLPFPAPKTATTQPLSGQTNADDASITIVVPGSASGPLGATNMTATSRTWVKPLHGRSGVLAVALVSVIAVVGVVGYVVRDVGTEKKAANAGSVEVVASVAPMKSTIEAPIAMPTTTSSVSTTPPLPIQTATEPAAPKSSSASAPIPDSAPKKTGRSNRSSKVQLGPGMQ